MSALHLPLGPVMCDVAGHALTEDERTRLRHPLVGGVILFARNFADPEQLAALCTEIHALRSPGLIIAVDHEGGRVQRFRTGFTRLPAMRALGESYARDPDAGLAMARHVGCTLAGELREQGVDLSFTPVLDLEYGRSAVIGDRAFGADSATVSVMAAALSEGLAEAGMGAVGKHFPGHGWAEADSHVAIPRDERIFEAVWAEDIAPYRDRVGKALAGVMPAHVIYENIDPRPAGFSRFWLQDVLRKRLGFQGVIFSDDLTMEGATVVGDIVARAEAAFGAGCDMVLVCNRPDLADDLLARWKPAVSDATSARIAALRPGPRAADGRLAEARAAVQDFVASLA
ncbi:beta-N-acetylhexosaminidase [Niveibacterium sp. SC-1]|uniref:beta-N-acetylhexosaminidase n=1 Tax=Niveibacterium sp. SC-1 TaxID=3135646 RepID=UPI00311EC834